MPTEDDHGDEHMPQELYDLFEAVDKGDGTQDESVHEELKQLHEAGLGKEAFHGDGPR